MCCLYYTITNVNKLSMVVHSEHTQTVHGLMYAVHLNYHNWLKVPVPVSLASFTKFRNLHRCFCRETADQMIRLPGNISVYMLPAATKDQLTVKVCFVDSKCDSTVHVTLHTCLIYYLCKENHRPLLLKQIFSSNLILSQQQ